MDRPTRISGKGRPQAAKRKRKMRWLTLLAAVMLPAAIVPAAFLIRYYYLFDAIIQDKLSARPSSALTEIYAAPAMLFPGKPAALEQLCAEARRLGYVERGTRTGAAWYEIKAKNRLVIHNDDLPLEYARRSVEVAFAGGRIRQLVDPDTRAEIEMFGLKPPLLSNFITSEREKRRFVPYAELPPVLINAVLAAEDRRFFTHAGVDPVRIVKALIVDIRQGQVVQGASTLTQQFVKNYFLTPERTLKRKLTDAYMSILLERRLSKQEIFELWANEVYLGQHGSFSIAGFGEAARVFFNKSVKDLTLDEAATLAGIIPAPNRYAPLRRPERARARRDQVLDAMAEYGMISAAECDQAKARPLETKPATALNYSDAPYFVDYVQEYLDERLGADNELARAHYKVFTTLDVALQQAAYEALREGLDEVDQALARGPRKIEPGTVQASLIAVDPVTGRILAMVGGRNYGTSQFNRITQSKRQPGSIYKPIVYAAALETAYTSAAPLTPVSSVLDAPARFAFDGLLYEPRNYKEEYLGQVSMRQAVARSLNIATIRFAEAVGFDKIAELARRLGLNEDIQPYPAMAIGAFEVTPLEMVRAYTAFAAGGMLAELLPVECVMGAANRPVFRAAPQRAQVISPQVAFMVTSLLQSVIREGTGAGVRARGFTLPAAGKTGSSHDGWFAGYTPELLCVAWVGFDDNKELNLPGSRSALPIWTAFMKRAAALRPLNGKEFEVPEDIVGVEVDPTTGYLATESCLYRQNEYFIKGTEPVLPCYGNSYGHTIGGAPASIYSSPKESRPGVDKNSAPPEARKPAR